MENLHSESLEITCDMFLKNVHFRMGSETILSLGRTKFLRRRVHKTN